MAGKYLCANLHLVWSTKGRRRLIDPQWRARLHSYMGGIARAKNATLKEDQDEHQERKSFEEELLELFGLHGIESDPRYVFD